jgi:hypothetical protein
VRAISTVRDLVARDEFRTAFWWGIGGLVLAIALGVSRAARDGRQAPVAGLAVAGAGAIALRATHGLPGDLLLGLVVLAGAGIIADVLGRPVLAGALLAIPGALLIGRTVPATPSWSAALAVVAIVGGGACVASFDARHGARGLGPPLFALAAAGVYFTVPDTEHALVLLGAALPLVLSSWPLPLTRLGSGGAYAATGLLAWTTATDGVARPASIVGGMASLGLLVAEPVGRAIGRSGAGLGPRPSPIDHLRNTWVAALWIGVAQLCIVLVTSRVAGLRDELAPAVLISAGVLTSVAIGCAFASPWEVHDDTGEAA